MKDEASRFLGDETNVRALGTILRRSLQVTEILIDDDGRRAFVRRGRGEDVAEAYTGLLHYFQQHDDRSRRWLLQRVPLEELFGKIAAQVARESWRPLIALDEQIQTAHLAAWRLGEWIRSALDLRRISVAEARERVANIQRCFQPEPGWPPLNQLSILASRLTREQEELLNALRFRGYIGVAEAAKRLGVHAGQISRAVNAGNILSNGSKGPARKVCWKDCQRWNRARENASELAALARLRREK
jgi:hypothetical protein